jgi:hypothetical protein
MDEMNRGLVFHMASKMGEESLEEPLSVLPRLA